MRAAQAWELLASSLAAQSRLVEAADAYRKLIELRPADVAAHGNLGNLLRIAGRLDEAAACYRRVLQWTNSPLAHNDLGQIAQSQGKLDEAVACYRRAIQLAPDFSEAHSNLGTALARQGQRDEALACCRRAIQLKPGYAIAHSDLGTILADSGRLDEAAASCRRSIELEPRNAQAHYLLGRSLASLERFAEAADCFDNVVRLVPASAEASNNLACALKCQGKLAEAVPHFERALALRPDYVDALVNLGAVWAEMKRFEDAIACYRQSLVLAPDHADGWHNLGAALARQDKLDEAVPCYRRAVALRPDSVETLKSLAVSALDQNRLESALSHSDAALALRPDDADAHLTRALTLLVMGRLAEGWSEYQWRFQIPGRDGGYVPRPVWTGQHGKDLTVVLRCEQGLGDTLQFVRYAALVKERVGRVVVECQQPLVRLLETCPGVDIVRACGEPMPPFDFHATLISLAGIFKTTLDNIPAPIPYVSADAAAIDRWRTELDDGSFKVGVAWQGSATYARDRFRSIPLAHFVPLAQVPRVRLYSLQMGPGRQQLSANRALPIEDLGDRLGDFYDTAAIVKNLDLVISCDSAPAHLAGALGVPAWIAMPLVPDWRWMLARADSPWYPTARLFRQRHLGDWQEPFERMGLALAELASFKGLARRGRTS